MAFLRPGFGAVCLTFTIALLALLVVGPQPGGPVPAAQAQASTIKVEWLGWSFFRFTTPGGKVILTNPYITGNADAAASVDDITQADLILIPDGHGDEVGDTVAIAQKTGAKVYGPSRLVRWLVEQGLPQDQAIGGNQGDRMRAIPGITVRQLFAVHDNSLAKPSLTVPYGGVASSFMITFENGYTLYFAASSATTSDMALWGSMYKPDGMIFMMAGPRDPLDLAMSIKLISTDNPNLKMLMPHHHRVSPGATDTTVAEVQAALADWGIGLPITNQVRSQVYELSK